MVPHLVHCGLREIHTDNFVSILLCVLLTLERGFHPLLAAVAVTFVTATIAHHRSALTDCYQRICQSNHHCHPTTRRFCHSPADGNLLDDGRTRSLQIEHLPSATSWDLVPFLCAGIPTLIFTILLALLAKDDLNDSRLLVHRLLPLPHLCFVPFHRPAPMLSMAALIMHPHVCIAVSPSFVFRLPTWAYLTSHFPQSVFAKLPPGITLSTMRSLRNAFVSDAPALPAISFAFSPIIARYPNFYLSTADDRTEKIAVHVNHAHNTNQSPRDGNPQTPKVSHSPAPLVRTPLQV